MEFLPVVLGGDVFCLALVLFDVDGEYWKFELPGDLTVNTLWLAVTQVGSWYGLNLTKGREVWKQWVLERGEVEEQAGWAVAGAAM